MIFRVEESKACRGNWLKHSRLPGSKTGCKTDPEMPEAQGTGKELLLLQATRRGAVPLSSWGTFMAVADVSKGLWDSRRTGVWEGEGLELSEWSSQERRWDFFSGHWCFRHNTSSRVVVLNLRIMTPLGDEWPFSRGYLRPSAYQIFTL